MAHLEREDARDGFQQYPHPQHVDDVLHSREPTNAELEMAARSGTRLGGRVPQRTNWPALVAVVAFYVVLIVLTFSIFPLDTWEFRFGP